MKAKLLPLALSIVILFFTNDLSSNTCTSSSGTFNSWALVTWTCTSAPTGGPPTCGDVINVASGTVIKVSADVDFSACTNPITLNIYGQLNFNTNGVRFQLPSGSTVVVQSGGSIVKTFPGGGSSTLISVGGTNVWTAGDGTITGPVVLPIELLSFSAVCNDKKVDIAWVTATETHNDYFTVERTKDGLSFETVSTVDGAGNSTQVLEYSVTDHNPYEGLSYYRLMNTGFDGAKYYSALVTSDCFITENGFSIYPNPSDGSGALMLDLNFPENQEIVFTVVDMQGKESYSKLIITKQDNELVAIDPSHKIAPGTYMVITRSENKILSKTLIIK